MRNLVRCLIKYSPKGMQLSRLQIEFKIGKDWHVITCRFHWSWWNKIHCNFSHPGEQWRENVYILEYLNKKKNSKQNLLQFLGCSRDSIRASMHFSAFCKMFSEWNVSKRPSLEKILIINSTLWAVSTMLIKRTCLTELNSYTVKICITKFNYKKRYLRIV